MMKKRKVYPDRMLTLEYIQKILKSDRNIAAVSKNWYFVGLYIVCVMVLVMHSMKLLKRYQIILISSKKRPTIKVGQCKDYHRRG